MSTQLQLRRGTTAEHSTFTGAAAEVTVDTTKDTVVVHDGATAGGVPLAKESHNHSGIYEPADATIIKDVDIGSSVQAYSANISTIKAIQSEMEAGTETSIRSMSPENVKQAISALSAPTGNYVEVIMWNHAAGSIGTFSEDSGIGSIDLGGVSGIDGSIATCTSSDLPTGLSLSTQGILTGTLENYTSNITLSFTVEASSYNNSDSRTFSIDVTAINNNPVWNTTSPLPGASIGQYSQQLSATDPENTTITYSVISGSFPASLSMSSSGLISGEHTAQDNSTYNITIRASDIHGNYTDRAFSIQSLPPTIIASGGTELVEGNYKYHVFTTSGTLNVTTVPAGENIEYIVVGGGGSGGSGAYGAGAASNGAAGGGGGVQHNVAFTPSVTSYNIVIGGGGSGPSAGTNSGGNSGTASSAFSVSAGGGYTNSGRTGGSSGSPQNNSGGGGGSYSGGGGGGSCGTGAGGGGNIFHQGGAGCLYNNFTSWGAAQGTGYPSPDGHFAGGGEGAGASASSYRSAGGGGWRTGSDPYGGNNQQNAGMPNTGGGGSGGYAQNEYPGNGGSGIVIARYEVV